MSDASVLDLTLICLNSILFWAPFEGTSTSDGTRGKNIEAGLYCSLMQEHAMCDVDSLSTAPPSPALADQSIAELNLTPIFVFPYSLFTYFLLIKHPMYAMDPL